MRTGRGTTDSKTLPDDHDRSIPLLVDFWFTFSRFQMCLIQSFVCAFRDFNMTLLPSATQALKTPKHTCLSSDVHSGCTVGKRVPFTFERIKKKEARFLAKFLGKKAFRSVRRILIHRYLFYYNQ